MPPVLYADALRYIREGIGVAHADYPHQPRQASPSPVQGIHILQSFNFASDKASRRVAVSLA